MPDFFPSRLIETLYTLSFIPSTPFHLHTTLHFKQANASLSTLSHSAHRWFLNLHLPSATKTPAPAQINPVSEPTRCPAARIVRPCGLPAPAP